MAALRGCLHQLFLNKAPVTHSTYQARGQGKCTTLRMFWEGLWHCRLCYYKLECSVWCVAPIWDIQIRSGQVSVWRDFGNGWGSSALFSTLIGLNIWCCLRYSIYSDNGFLGGHMSLEGRRNKATFSFNSRATIHHDWGRYWPPSSTKGFHHFFLSFFLPTQVRR